MEKIDIQYKPGTQRIPGFDLARAYAIFGMFIVNFNFAFGTFTDRTPTGLFLNLFVGNSTAIFIILAGMGTVFMLNVSDYQPGLRKHKRRVIMKRSWFLFVLGLMLYNWWPGDILHFYGGYMHIAAFLLFVHRKWYLWIAGSAIIIYHVLLLIIPVETSWNFTTFSYDDFWTVVGFARNTLYNGWNSVFPWIAYFMLGMWLGKLNWQSKTTQKYVFITGVIMFASFQLIRVLARSEWFSEPLTAYIMSDYFPPCLPFMFLTTGFALMVIPFCIFLGERCKNTWLVGSLLQVGQMTLSHYVIHLTIGMLLLSALSGKRYSGVLVVKEPLSPFYILCYAVAFFCISILFTVLWRYKFKNGPLEILMRKISG